MRMIHQMTADQVPEKPKKAAPKAKAKKKASAKKKVTKKSGGKK